MNWILDLILLAVFIVAVVFSAKKGIVRTLLEIAAFVLSIFLAFQLAAPMAESFYDNFLEVRVQERIEEKLPAGNAVESNTEKAVAVLEGIPSFAKKYLENSGFNADALAQQIALGRYSNSSIAEELEENFAKPASVAVLTATFFLLLCIVLCAVLQAIAGGISKLFKAPIVSTLNKGLGALFGAVKGLVIVCIAAILLSVFAPRIGGAFQTAVDSSRVIAFAESNLFESFSINF